LPAAYRSARDVNSRLHSVGTVDGVVVVVIRLLLFLSLLTEAYESLDYPEPPPTGHADQRLLLRLTIVANVCESYSPEGIEKV